MSNKNILHISKLDVDEVLKYLKTSSKGLNLQDVHERKLLYGENIIKKSKNFNFLKQFIKQFSSFIAILLWAAGFLSLCIGHFEVAIAIFLVIIINGLFSFFQEYKADKVLNSLENMIPKKIQVYRQGKIEMISVIELTIGDIIFIENGIIVPADVRIIESNNLFVDNSMLSGETVPLNRTALSNYKTNQVVSEISNLVYAGTTVIQGSAKAVVYAIGDKTQIGEVSMLSQTIDKGSSTLDYEIHKIVKKISWIAFSLSILVFFLFLFVEFKQYGEIKITKAIIVALGMLVANIPEGLLPTVSLSLAVGSQRMAKQNALIKRLSSVETLSSTTVICTDKTGTLTNNQLTVRKILTPDDIVEITGLGYQKKGQFLFNYLSERNCLEKLLVLSILCSESNISLLENNSEDFEIIGSPIEGSLLIAATKYGFDVNQVRDNFSVLKVTSFSSDTKKMSVLVINNNDHTYDINSKFLFVKGAPNIILENCSMQYKNNTVHSFTSEEKTEFLNKNNDFSSEGFRILAMAYKKIEQNDDQEIDMIFLGFAINYDPPKLGVKEAVNDLINSGLKITILTGDYGLTAVAIGKQVGIIKNDFINISGYELDNLSNLQLQKILKTSKPVVFSRITPKHKLQIIQAYRANGEIVGVTGDGVNDILAMKAAHIGIAMGKSNKDIVFNSADMILLDDNFSTISKALLEGRGVYENIKKFITYVFASNVPQIFPIILMVLFNINPYLTVLQILAIDLLTDLIPAIALGAEEPDSFLMHQKPRKVNDHLLDKKVFIRAYLFLGFIEGLISLVLFLYYNGGYRVTSNDIFWKASTMALGGVIFSQIGNVFACRSDKLFFWKTLYKKNKILYLGILCEILLFLFIVNTGLTKYFETSNNIELKDYLLLFVCPIIVLICDTLWKKFYISKKHNS